MDVGDRIRRADVERNARQNAYYGAQLIFYRRGMRGWHSEIGDRITRRIRRLRLESDEMTQRELAERIGVTRQTVVAIEGNKYSPSLEVAFRIAHVFGMPVHGVFLYTVEEDDAFE